MPETVRPEGKCPDTVRPERKCPATLRPVSRCRGELRLGVWCRGELHPNSHCLCILRWEQYVRCQGASRVSPAPGASGHSLCVRTHIFFPDVAAIPPLLSSPFIIHAIIVLVPSYLLSSMLLATSSPPSSSSSCSSRRIVQLPTVCWSDSCTNNLTKLVDLLDASYLLSSTLPASSSTSYLSRLTCYHPPCWHPHRHRTCCVLLAIIHAAGILTAILIDIILVASLCTTSHCWSLGELR